MIIAVTAQEPDTDSAVDPRFGRASFFVVTDTNTDERRIVDNAINAGAVQGAGIQAAQNVVAQGVDVVLTGSCGPKAFRVLRAAGIEVCVGITGTVNEALQQYAGGSLTAATSPDVEGHW
jgi:predicted Fe-Mo cluster-binding NifX family protein